MSAKTALASFIWQQSWLSPRYKKTAYKVLNKSGAAPEAAFSADFFGLKYEGNLRNNIEFSIYYYGAFEKPLLFFLRDTLAKLTQHQDPALDTVFCDVGANIGQHSLYMSQHARIVHSFEPFQEVSKRLEQQIQLNGIQNINLHCVGLSDISEQLPFYAPTGSNQGIGSFDKSTESKGNRELGQLSLKKGDEFFKEIPIAKVDLMKVDVEGFEKRTISGLQQVLEQNRPIIVCEVTYDNEIGFQSIDELRSAFPQNYEFFIFDIRKPDGSKDRRRGARSKRTGEYNLIALEEWKPSGQDDVVACPKEKNECLSLSGK